MNGLMCTSSCTCKLPLLQFRRPIPAPADRTSASAWLCKHPWITCQKLRIKKIKEIDFVRFVHIKPYAAGG